MSGAQFPAFLHFIYLKIIHVKFKYSENIILIRIRSIGLKISMFYLLKLIAFTVAPVEWVEIQVLTDYQNESDFKPDWLTDWLTNRTEWLTDWLIDWLTWLTDWSDWLTDYITWLSDGLTNRTDWQTQPAACRLVDLYTYTVLCNWLIDWHNWQTKWQIGLMFRLTNLTNWPGLFKHWIALSIR